MRRRASRSTWQCWETWAARAAAGFGFLSLGFGAGCGTARRLRRPAADAGGSWPGAGRRGRLDGRPASTATITIGALNLQDMVVPAKRTPYNSALPVTHQTIIVLDFGSQFTQLIARRLRELSVYSEILPFNTPLAAVLERAAGRDHPVGRPEERLGSRAHRTATRRCSTLGVPVLGICYGMQLMTAHARRRRRAGAAPRVRPRDGQRRAATRRCSRRCPSSCGSGRATATS